MNTPTLDAESLVLRLRAAGCVFAEEEAGILEESALDEAHLLRLCERRERGEPLEQLVGWVDFGGLRLSVGPGVFIPRQRTLFLAGLTLAAAREQSDPVVLEAFSGAAPVAAWVAHHLPEATVHASDADAVALAHAERNLGSGAAVSRGTVLSAVPPRFRGAVDVLAAVPPYVPESEALFMSRESREHEPGAAVYAGADGLDFVRAVIDEADPWLSPTGRILLEMNREQLAAAAVHAEVAGYDVERLVAEDGHTGVLRLSRSGSSTLSYWQVT